MVSGAEVVVFSDDPVLRSLVRDLLSQERLGVAEAGDEPTLRAIVQHEQGGTPLLVIDGILGSQDIRTLLGRLAILCHGHAIPRVLLLTGSGAPAELREHVAVTAVLVVPFAAAELVHAVHALCQPDRARSETRLRVATPMPEGGAGAG